jgi:hypothetical protein
MRDFEKKKLIIIITNQGCRAISQLPDMCILIFYAFILTMIKLTNNHMHIYLYFMSFIAYVVVFLMKKFEGKIIIILIFL